MAFPLCHATAFISAFPGAQPSGFCTVYCWDIENTSAYPFPSLPGILGKSLNASKPRISALSVWSGLQVQTWLKISDHVTSLLKLCSGFLLHR